MVLPAFWRENPVSMDLSYRLWSRLTASQRTRRHEQRKEWWRVNTSLYFFQGRKRLISLPHLHWGRHILLQRWEASRVVVRLWRKSTLFKPDCPIYMNLNEFLGKVLESMSHSLWHVPLCRDHVWCPLSLLWGPEFPLITPQLLDEVMPAVVPRITVRPPNTQLLNHVKRAPWWVGRCPWNVTTSWISSLSFASVWIGCQNDKQKSPVRMYSDTFSLLSTYCVPDTTINTFTYYPVQASQQPILQVRKGKLPLLTPGHQLASGRARN